MEEVYGGTGWERFMKVRRRCKVGVSRGLRWWKRGRVSLPIVLFHGCGISVISGRQGVE